MLIVEDEMFVSWGLEAALVEHGHIVCGIAQSAEEALQLAKAHRPDLIFMDIGLFGPSDGLEVARRILADRPTRIVFSSAWNDPRTLAVIEELGAYANIPKPCREADLVAVADRAWREVLSATAS
ncbi:response regulator [Phenylobacterium sp. 58.2.17]|uniref:response regulator n=1 Tax=Phenylobacterium sp. 58.2.17 TaxID=2969306 RepID=UPI002265320A|nr:response regulator [Phenylobacterium sp. 58.2.17]MCX7585313.1 response regulator [Phenylobacterium sp. 58.2.17]